LFSINFREFILELAKNPPEGVSVGLGEDDNMFVWELMLIGPQETLYEGGFFSAKLEFPQDFPNSPPVMTFLTPMWHPNGTVMYVAPCVFLFSNSLVKCN
jgi:ubiquitin-conjugating enzyme E2 G1